MTFSSRACRRPQCVGLSFRPRESEDQLLVESLTQGMLSNELLQLGDEQGGAPQVQIGGDATLESRETEFEESLRFGLNGWFVAQVSERHSAPQRKRSPEKVGSACRVREQEVGRPSGEVLELEGVELRRCDTYGVAVLGRADHILAQRLPQT